MLKFSKAIRLRRSGLPVMLRTTGEAIDMIQDFPDEIRRKAHWRTAELALCKVEETDSIEILERAQNALIDALASERWLYKG